MLHEADRIFSELLSSETRDQQLAKVRFYLAKTHYLNGNVDLSKQHLEKALDFLPANFLDESYLIQAQLAYEQGDVTAATAYLKQISPNAEQGLFAKFNLAIFLLQSGQLDTALDLFDELYPSPESSDVQRSLFDRANLAIGYHYLANNDDETAREYLLKVRLDGPSSHRAMLALGWAYSKAGLHTKAIAYWRELLTRDARNPAVQEALLALAFSYFNNGAKREALETFVQSAAVYGEQINLIDSAQKDLDNNLFREWIDSRGVFGEKVFSRWVVGDVPVTTNAIEYYLQEVTATNEFNQYFHRYQEMYHLQQVLARWLRQIPIYREMLSNHEKRYNRLKPQVDERLKNFVNAGLKEQLSKLQRRVEQGLAEDDLWLLATTDELEVYQDLMRVKDTLDSIPASEFDMEEQYDQWRRIFGASLWKIAEEYGPRRYLLESNLKQAQQAAEEFDLQAASVGQADKVAGTRFLHYDDRINELEQEVNTLNAEIEIVLERSRQAMKQVLVDKLTKRRKELDFLLAQAELSIAKIQDEAINRILESTDE
nr:tetratricopeptide repeat protein [Pleionea sp. CnH1-48]